MYHKDVQKHVTSWEWIQEHYDDITSSKLNIITKINDHNGSTGYYYSYSNKGNYVLVNNYSMAQHSCKKFKSNKKTIKAIVEEVVMEEMSAHKLGVRMVGMCRIILP